MNKIKHILIITILFTALTANAEFVYFKPQSTFFERVFAKVKECHIKIPCYFRENLGAAFTTIASTDRISAFVSTYNTNLAQTANTTTPNTWSDLQQFSRASSTQLSAYDTFFGRTATSSFGAGGALTLATPLTAANGGTGSSTLASNRVLLGNGTGAVNVVTSFGSSGQTLQSQGDGLAPQWAANVTDQNAAYTWTGLHRFYATTTFNAGINATGTTMIKNLNASSTSASPIVFNGISLNTPSIQGASSTALFNNGSGTLIWDKAQAFELIADISATGSVSTIGASGLSNRSHYTVILSTRGKSTGNVMELRFNGDQNSNYDSRRFEEYRLSGSGQNAGQISIGDTGTTTAEFFKFEITNFSTLRKQVSWTSTMAASSSVFTGAGSWKNEVDAISAIQFAGGGGNFLINSKLWIYASKD